MPEWILALINKSYTQTLMQIELHLRTMMNRYVFSIFSQIYWIFFLTWYFCVFVSTNLCFRLQVTGVMTQGRGDGKEWVTSFKVSYSMDDYNELYVTDQYSNHRVIIYRLIVGGKCMNYFQFSASILYISDMSSCKSDSELRISWFYVPLSKW